MIDELTRDDWDEILSGVEPPSVAEVADEIGDRFGLDATDAEGKLDDALDGNAPITQDEDAGMLGHVVLADAGNNERGEDESETADELDNGEDPTVEDHEPDAVVGDDKPGVLDRAEASGRHFYTPHIKDRRSWWINWVRALPLDDDGEIVEDAKPTKQPVDPDTTGSARPVSWRFDLPEDEHPCTDFEVVRPWQGYNTNYEITAPDRVVSDEIGLGIILPVGQGPDRPEDNDRTVVLIDWDDVRDPETGEIHPVVGRVLAELDGYAEISQSGEGIHQFVFGEIPGGLSKFIRHIDDEPFVGDDLPAVEMYQSGRVCAMTGDHVEGSGEDVVDGQDMIDRLCWQFGTADNAGPGTPSDPYADERDADAVEDNATVDDGEIPDHETIGKTLREAAEYDGEDPDEWEIPDEYNLEYVAVLKARQRDDETLPVANWELNGYAAAWGYQLGLDKQQVIADLRDVAPDDDSIKSEVRQPWRKVKHGETVAPSRATLARSGILPDRYATEDATTQQSQMVVLPDEDGLEPTTDADAVEGTAVDDLDDEPDYGELTRADARQRTKATIKDAYNGNDDVLVDALMSMGKSYGSVAAAVETDTRTTILTGRGRKEQYDVLRDWADQHGLDVGDKGQPNGDVYVLPSFKKDCPTANGEAGDGWADLVGRWYDAGASPAQIHAYGSVFLEDNDEIDADELPCQHEGRCPYSEKWDFEPDDFALLIGHYSHAYRPKVLSGEDHQRTAVLDEFPEAWETTIRGDSLRAAINDYLDEHGRAPSDDWADARAQDGPRAIPYQNFGGLLLDRDNKERRETALAYLDHHGVEPDERGAIEFAEDADPPEHALAPLAIYTILNGGVGGQLGNRYEHVELPHGNGIGVFDHGDDDPNGRPGVSLLRPPRLDVADNVVGLDGTPTTEMWRLATGRDLDHETILEDRRAEYVETALGYRIVPTTEYVKPYNRAQHVNVAEDAALLDGITEHHGRAPGVITSRTARDVWDDEDVIDYNHEDEVVEDGPVSAMQIYGNVLGSNRFSDEDLGVVVGSNHYGDGFIKRWGAYAGKAVQRQHVDGEDADERPKGETLSYGPFGDKIHRHMREHDTLQSVFRFGRNTDGATIYVATDTLPDWLPTHGRADVSTTSDGMRSVLRALDELDVASVSAIHEHDAVEISRQQLRTHLSTLRDREVVDWGDDPEDARKTLYSVVEDAGISDHGFVDLPDETTIGRGSATAYVREPGGDDGDDDAVEADGGGSGLQEITPPPSDNVVDVWGMPVPTDIPGTLRFDIMGADAPTRCVDEWGRVWYTYESESDGVEHKTKQRAVPAASNRRRRRPPRRAGTRRVGHKSRRRAGPSRFAVTDDEVGHEITTDCYGDAVADD